MKDFIKNNYLYIIWFILYYTIACFIIQDILIVSIIYAISITIALSPVGEFLFRTIEGAREIETSEEKEYLLELFEEVYKNALEENPKLSPNIKLYISDTMAVNAFALGKNSVIITRGAMQTFTQNELKGVLGHELGHISHGHTKALLLTFIGNVFFSWIIILVKFTLTIMRLVNALMGKSDGYLPTKILFIILGLIFDIACFIFLYVGQIILSINSRQNEYQADEFACLIGYQEELISALYLLQKISLGEKIPLSEKIKSSHPHIAKRIANLENLEVEEVET